MSNKETVKIKMPDGTIKDVPGIPSKIIKSNETWSEIELEDGAIIQYRPVVIKVHKIENLFDNEGNPVYSLQTAQIMTVKATENLKKK